MQVLVRILDHVYALNQGALRSGQPNLVAQLGSFQNACRDAARRVGLTPFVAKDSEPFDAQRHQLVEGDTQPFAGAVVRETIASGYTFQGKLLRPALVQLRQNNGEDVKRIDSAPTESESPQAQLELGAARTAQPGA